MTPFYLRFDSEQIGLEALKVAKLATETKTGIQFNTNLDVIGDLWDPAVYAEGAKMGDAPPTPATKLPGWHVNALLEELPDALLPYVVEPISPRRVFAGWSPQEIAAREVKPEPIK